MKVSIDKAKNELTIVLPMLASPVESASGKSMVVCKTGGFAATTIAIDGQPLRLNVTAIL